MHRLLKRLNHQYTTFFVKYHRGNLLQSHRGFDHKILNSLQPSSMTKLQEEALFVKKLSENAVLPVRGSAGAAGYDLAR